MCAPSSSSPVMGHEEPLPPKRLSDWDVLPDENAQSIDMLLVAMDASVVLSKSQEPFPSSVLRRARVERRSWECGVFGWSR